MTLWGTTVDISESGALVKLDEWPNTADRVRLEVTGDYGAKVLALAHRKHLLRANQRNPKICTHGQVLPTNTQEPIGWAVEVANQIYVESALPELKHEVFRDLFPKDNFSVDIQNRAMTIAHAYQGMVKDARVMDDRLKQRKPEDQQPTAKITTLKGTVLMIRRMLDVEWCDEIWRSDGMQKDWVLEIERDEKSPEGLKAAIVTPQGK